MMLPNNEDDLMKKVGGRLKNHLKMYCGHMLDISILLNLQKVTNNSKGGTKGFFFEKKLQWSPLW